MLIVTLLEGQRLWKVVTGDDVVEIVSKPLSTHAHILLVSITHTVQILFFIFVCFIFLDILIPNHHGSL